MNSQMTGPPPARKRIALSIAVATSARDLHPSGGTMCDLPMNDGLLSADPAFNFHHFSSWLIPAPARCGPELVVTKEETPWKPTSRARRAAHHRMN